MGEVEEEPLYTTEENNPLNGMWKALDRPQKGDVNTQPNNWLDDHRDDDHQHKDTPRLILYADKKSTQPDNFPRRENNILKAVHQRIVNSNNPASVPPAGTAANEIPSYGALGKRTGQEAVRHLDEMASSPELGYDRNKTGTRQPLPAGNSQVTQTNNFPRRENNILKAVHQRIVNGNNRTSGQKAEAAVTGIPSYGMVGKRVGPEAIRYVEEMASAPKSVYDRDKINTNISIASPRPYIDAPGMTLEEIEAFLKNMTPAQKDSIDRVYNGYAEDARRDLQKSSGEKIKPVKAVIFDPNMEGRAPIQYKNDTITAKRGFLERGENMKRSLLVHEMQHHTDKDKLPFRWGKDNMGNTYIYNESTYKQGVPYLEPENPDFLKTMPDYFTRLISMENNDYKYSPSNSLRAEINAINAQLNAHNQGIIPLKTKEVSKLELNKRTQEEQLAKTIEYEKQKGYDSTGYPL